MDEEVDTQSGSALTLSDALSCIVLLHSIQCRRPPPTVIDRGDGGIEEKNPKSKTIEGCPQQVEFYFNA